MDVSGRVPRDQSVGGTAQSKWKERRTTTKRGDEKQRKGGQTGTLLASHRQLAAQLRQPRSSKKEVREENIGGKEHTGLGKQNAGVYIAKNKMGGFFYNGRSPPQIENGNGAKKTDTSGFPRDSQTLKTRCGLKKVLASNKNSHR